VTKQVTVGSGGNPVASFTVSPSAAAVGAVLNFNASASTASPGRLVSSYSWDFGDGSSGSGATTQHAYTNAGSYTVTLIVTDTQGRVSTPATKSVTVGAASPTAVIGFSSSGLTVQFDAGNSLPASGGTLVSWQWDFGDTVTGSGSTISHTYAGAGTYTVKLKVTDSDGAFGTATVNVTVP
jgi:PKD repeat protein